MAGLRQGAYVAWGNGNLRQGIAVREGGGLVVTFSSGYPHVRHVRTPVPSTKEQLLTNLETSVMRYCRKEDHTSGIFQALHARKADYLVGLVERLREMRHLVTKDVWDREADPVESEVYVVAGVYREKSKKRLVVPVRVEPRVTEEYLERWLRENHPEGFFAEDGRGIPRDTTGFRDGMAVLHRYQAFEVLEEHLGQIGDPISLVVPNV